MSVGKKAAIVIALGAVAWVLYFFLAFQPKTKEIEDLLKNLQDVRMEMQRQKSIADNLPKFNRDIDILRGQLKESINQLPNDKDIAQLLDSMTELASGAGVRITKFSPTPETVKGFYAELPIKLDLIGGYHNTAIFFDKIGKLNRIINISDVNIKNPQVVEGETVVDITCTCTTYRFLETETLR